MDFGGFEDRHGGRTDRGSGREMTLEYIYLRRIEIEHCKRGLSFIGLEMA